MVQFITENFDVILQIIAGIVAIFSLIASITPNPTDDGIAKTLNKIVDTLALNFGNAKKERE